MAIQERDKTRLEQEREQMAANKTAENKKEEEVVVVTRPYRETYSPPWWRGIGSPLGIGFISLIVMIGLLFFSIGASQSGAQSSGTTSSDSSSSSSGMSMGSTSSTTSTGAIPNATVNQGNQPAKYVIDPDGAKHFTFVTQQVMWEVVKGHRVPAFTINGMVPGPMIHVTAGDHVRVTLINELNEATALHWHGLELPASEDGVPGIGMKPLQPGQTYVYDFTVHDQDVGTHWYHSHYDDQAQVGGGMYGAFIVDPRPGTQEARQQIHTDIDQTIFIGSLGGYYIMNGKSFPDTTPVIVKHGQTVRLRLVGADTFSIHPMHLHGHTFSIVAEDGHPLAQPIQKDTVQVAPGETYDIVFNAWAAPGSIYPFHCHILSHVMNPGQSGDEMGGLITLIEYAK